MYKVNINTGEVYELKKDFGGVSTVYLLDSDMNRLEGRVNVKGDIIQQVRVINNLKLRDYE